MLVISLVSNYLLSQRKEKKNNLRTETFPAAERTEKTGNREIQNELLEISLL